MLQMKLGARPFTTSQRSLEGVDQQGIVARVLAQKTFEPFQALACGNHARMVGL